RDFATVESYLAFVEEVRQKLNAPTAARLAEERKHLAPLPPCRLPEYSTYEVVVRQWSTIHFGKKTYSVPSRLIGSVVEVRQHPDIIEVFYRNKLTATMPRLRGDQPHRIDYRHVIWSLVRKPGAFARYRYREELFPSLTFRRAYDALTDARGERAGRRVRPHSAPGRQHARIARRSGARGAARQWRSLRLRRRQSARCARGTHRPRRAHPRAQPSRLRQPARRRRCSMSADVNERIAELLTLFKLPTMASECVRRFRDAGHDAALPVFLETLEAELGERRVRRCDRLLRASRLPPGKTFETLDEQRLPKGVTPRLRELASGAFLERAANVLCFGLPGTGKTHAACALGHALVRRGHAVLFTPTFQLVQELLAAKRDLALPRALRKLDAFEVIILD